MFYCRLAFQYLVLEAQMSEHGGVKPGSPAASQRNDDETFGERVCCWSSVGTWLANENDLEM
jgi:hypothetical protein